MARAGDCSIRFSRICFERANAFRDEHTRVIDSKEEFYDFFTPKNPAKPEIHGGFALAHWNGSRAVEEQIKNDLKVTIRCIPFGEGREPGQCIFTGEPSARRVVWAKVVLSYFAIAGRNSLSHCVDGYAPVYSTRARWN